ncbi:hypothetical protein KAW50_05070 [candidate division WOR-3 bacterium]|nr:hypothetical protein [candidate division WOR-3 bacterium]
MDKKVLSDLEKMNKDRAIAEAEYAAQKEEVTEVFRIMREGIQNDEELVTYLVACINDAKHVEDVARQSNNTIMYSEAVGIRREFVKLLKLMMIEEDEKPEDIDGTEEKHRLENDGEEGYV